MDPDTTDELNIAHAIMHEFQYSYRDRWVPQKVIIGTHRRYVRVFNELVKQGFIERKKSFSGYQYRWQGKFPD